MSAVKIIFKRSSILGKRPTGANLEPGELGLNTNSNDPGIFLEVNDGSVVKAGPTAYLPEAPTTEPSLGELWVDTDTKALSIGTSNRKWQTVAAPFLGGTAGYTVFVAPDYPNATDSLSNDGQTVPFITVNRAALEVTKQIIQQTINNTSLGNSRYLIVLAPGRHCVVNGPGTSVSQFTVDYSSRFASVTQAGLQQFNPSVGGLILPRGVSIVGLDLKKCEIHPTYVPKYTHPLFPPGYTQKTNGPVYENEPPSSVFRWSGNTYQTQITCLDKIDSRVVIAVSSDPSTGVAVFRSSQAHGLNYNDFVQVDYSNSADQSNATFASGAYYANPVNAFEFQVSEINWTSSQALPVLATALPSYFFVSSANELPKLVVENIYPYYIPEDSVSFEKSNYSHHRLSLNKNASISQLNEFYTKVQKAFPVYFGGQINTALASAPEYDIVAETAASYPLNTTSNSVDNSSPYQNVVSQRSNYGMANGDFDGDLVTGFKSVILNETTSVALQKDPAAYEVYSSVDQIWLTLTASVLKGLPVGTSITSVPTGLQLQTLNETSIPNIRYYYDTIKTTGLKSTGLADPDNDFRHFGFRLSGSNSFVQAQSAYIIGAAIGVWATRGAQISIDASTTNFGSVALQAEGFAGITTLGGANQVGRGFLLSGIVRPLRLLEQQVTSDNQKRILSLGSQIVHIGIDPADPSVQQIYLQKSFDPAGILPFSLNPGSALFTTDGICTFRGFFVTDGTFTCVRSETDATLNPYSPGGAILRLRLSDSSIPNGDPAGLDIPYIRRYIDPRTASEKSYAFYVQSTNPTSQAPQLGSVLRLNQTGQSLSNTIKRNYQFDPGQYGGIAQIFTVDSVETEQYSASPNFNYKIGDVTQATNYVVYASLTDASAPWTQSTTVPTSSLAPFNTPQGSYTTFQYRNYYAAENNLWDSLYYRTNFTPISGPTKASPNSADSPFVVSSVLQKQEVITDAWQGYVPDPNYDYYVNKIPAPYNAGLTYLRGSVVPYTEYPVQFQVDLDDSSDDLGIIFKRLENPTSITISVAASTIAQSFVAMSTPYVANPTFGRPEVIQMELLAVQQLQNPKQGVTILKLTNPSVSAIEYVRVVSLNSNVIQAIRNYYPEYSQGTLPAVWPKGTVITSCVSTGYPEPSVYDPNWSVTKSTMFRFYELMGYSYDQVSPYLVPQYFGNRVLANTSIPYTPINGYANLTAAWPVEFNNPSIIFASNHTWQYAGYLDYSRGLPKYQVNEISRKLQFDYFSTTSWGGRLTVSGTNEAGNAIFLGPMREALTGRYFTNESPLLNPADRLTYTSPAPVDFPSPVLVYSTDDISGLFDGSTDVFELTRGGYPIPGSQLLTSGVFVFVGGVAQLPYISYSIQLTPGGLPLPRIQFTQAPPAGASCDIRVVTSDDLEDSVEVVTLSATPGFDGVVSSFALAPADPTVSNLNSFVFLGGVEQNPYGLAQTSAAYNITGTPTTSELSFIGGSPLSGTTLNIRAILSGSRFRNAGISTVFVASVDDIAPLFDSTKTTFPLEIDGLSLDPVKVNSQNMFVSLGGVMQIPIANVGDPLAGNAYTVKLNSISKVLEITFAAPPVGGSTCNIRVITSDEFITCPLPGSLTDTTLRDGPGIVTNNDNQIISIDPGLIG